MAFMAPRRNVRPVVYSGKMTTPKDDVPMLQLEVLKQIQAELVSLRHEVTNVKTEVASVRTELKAEVASVRTELKAELASVRTELKEEISSLRRDTHQGFVRLRTELIGLRDDMEVGFTALRIQNDRRFLDHEGRLRALESDR